jgi:hypothetical protein
MLPESFTMTEFLNQLDTLELPALEAPQLYADRSILKVFLYALIRQITSFKLLAKILLEKTEIRQACNLKTAPHHVPRVLHDARRSAVVSKPCRNHWPCCLTN